MPDVIGTASSPPAAGILLGFALVLAPGCGNDDATTSETSPTSGTETGEASQTETGESETICAAFEPGEPFVGDYFGPCWAAGSAEACAAAETTQGGSCHAAFARELECPDEGSPCRLGEARFVECQDLDECAESSPPIVCRLSGTKVRSVLELLESSCLIYGTSTCTPPEGFDIADYEVCAEP